MKERTLAIIKPDAVAAGLVPDVMKRIMSEGFAIAAVKPDRYGDVVFRKFYAEHSDRPFFADLCAFMASGEVYVMILERDNAIAHWRSVLGATDSRKAEPGTLRALYGNKDGVIWRNVAHGSDSPDAAVREIGFFLGQENARRPDYGRPTFARKGQPIDVPEARAAVADAIDLAGMFTENPALFALAIVVATLATGLGACLDEIKQLRKDRPA